MRKNRYLIFVISFLLSICIICEKDTLTEINPNSTLSIVLVETNETYFTDSDFEWYLPSSCEVALNNSGIKKWNSYIRYDSTFNPPIPKLGNHYQKEFVLKIDDIDIYHGIFTSDLSSTIFNSIVIKDIIMEKDTINNKFQIEIQSTGEDTVPDLRNDQRIIEFFQLKNKLLNYS